MPIDIDQTTTTAPATQPLVATKLYVDRLLIDERDRTRPPTLDLTATPYAVADDGTPTYASVSEQIKTGDAYALAGVVPEVGVAMYAIFAAVAATRRRIGLNRASLAAAQQAVGVAQQAATALKAPLATAEQARIAAYVARGAIADQASAEWADAQAALVAADAAYQSALAACNDADAAVGAAQARVEIGKKAVDDPANPPLAEATA